MIIPLWQKILSCFLYLLPWSDGIIFGRYLFEDFPFLVYLQYLALPIWVLEQIVPLGLGSLILFLALFIGIARNPQMPYFLRFNTLQALLINITVFLLTYAFQIFIQPIGGKLIIRTLSSTIFIILLAIIMFAFKECLEGKKPDLPGISEAVKIQL